MKGGNPENLDPVRSKDEARIRGQKGGIASGKARRRKKAMKTMLNEMLTTTAPESKRAKLTEMGLDADDDTWQAVMLASLIQEATSGGKSCIAAMQLIANLAGDDPYVKARQSEVKTKRDELKLKERQIENEEKALQSKEQGEDFGDLIDAAFNYDAARRT